MASLLMLLPAHSENAGGDDSQPWVKSRARVIIDNDFGGDPDGLFQLAHQLLSPSVEVRGIIGSHHYPKGFYGYAGSSEHGVEMAKELLNVMGLGGKIPVFQGANERIKDLSSPAPSEAAQFIIRESMRSDVSSPLYVVCGAGLTDLASACLIEPKIAERIRVIWIGGPEHEGLASPPPGKPQIEYNLGIDVKAAQVVFNQSALPIWQVPRNTYRQALVSYSELQLKLDGKGKLGSYLLGRLQDLMQRAKGSLGEAYVLGDSPLVLLSALQSSWEVDPSSSDYVTMHSPRISDKGGYEKNLYGREIRVYTHLDTRLMFEDLYAKIARFEAKAR